jgi:hypothetical protein
MRVGINILTVIIPIAIVLTVTIIAFAVYKAAYRRKINKRLAEGREADIKPMMSPVKFVVITLIGIIVGIIILWILILFAASSFTGFRKSNDGLTTRILAYEMLDNSPLAGYKTGDEINGYTDYVKDNENGTLRLHIYVVDREYRSMFPPVLVAAEYLGDKHVSCLEFDEEYNDGRATRNQTMHSYKNENVNDTPVLHVYTNESSYIGDANIKCKIWFDDETKECDEMIQTSFFIDKNGNVEF